MAYLIFTATHRCQNKARLNVIQILNRRQQRPMPKLPLDHRDVHAFSSQLACVGRNPSACTRLYISPPLAPVPGDSAASTPGNPLRAINNTSPPENPIAECSLIQFLTTIPPSDRSPFPYPYRTVVEPAPQIYEDPSARTARSGRSSA